MRNKPRKSNENAFMTILNLIVDPAVIVGEKGQILLVNNAFEDLTGLSKEVIGKVFLEVDLLTPESKAILLKNLMKRMQGLPVEPYEITFTDKTGKARCAEVKAKKIDYAGQSADLVIFRDITRRKESARRLKKYSEKMEALVNEKVKEVKESEKKHRELINGMNDTAWVIDFDCKFIDVNDAAVKVLGYSREELLSMKVFDIDFTLDPEKIKALIKGMPRDEIQVFETAHTTKDGKTIPVEISSSLVTYQGKQAILSIARDITERKQMEKVLRESEEKYRTQFEEALDAIFVADAETGVIVDCNRAASELVGREKSEIIGNHQRILHPPEEIKGKFSRTFKQHLKEKEGQVLETQVITKNGEIKDVAIKASVFELRGKKLIQGIFRDITKGKRMEERLLESEERLRNLYENIPDSLAVFVGREGHLLEYNKAFKKRTGYTDEELKDKTFLDFVYPDDRAMILKKYRTRYPEEELPLVFEIRDVNKKGEALPTEVSVSTYKKKGRVIGIEVLHRDISERKRMEDELKQERDMLESVTENIGAGLAIISKDYRILWANKLLKQAGDIENKVCYSTFNTIDTVCPDCGVKKVFETSVSFDSHEYRCPFEKGKDRWIELIVTPIKDKNGTVIAALELSIDITEKKLMQNKLAEYSQKLEKIVEKRTEQLKQTQAKLVKSERLATIGELAAMVGHDLRNPLTGIMGAAYYLKAKHGTEVGAKGKEMLEIIENAINYSNKIINDLLEYSQDLKLEFTETTPKAMVQSALSLLEVPEKIQIIDATKDKPAVKADTEKIRKGFVNIIQNAIDAMPEGGTLTIKSRKVKGTLEIAFQDTGAGMSEEALSKLEGGVPLFTTKSKGMGFGLPICRRLVEAHGGKTSVESIAGKGTTVTVTIPVNPEPVNEREEKWIFSESMLAAITAANRAR